MVYSERKRAAERDAAEATGQDLWTEELVPAVRGKLVSVWRLVTNSNSDVERRLTNLIHTIIRNETGDLRTPRIEEALLRGSEATVFDYLDAIHRAIDFSQDNGGPFLRNNLRVWDLGVNGIFSSHRVKFKFVDGQIIPLASEELHSEVVERVLMLLHARPDLDKAQKAYREALEEISKGKPDNAITDAGTALQESLEALGCTGNTLGALINSAKTSGLLGSYDDRMTNGFENMMRWASKERNEGETHHAVDTSAADAWLMVHVVGALIVRLADGPRTKPTP